MTFEEKIFNTIEFYYHSKACVTRFEFNQELNKKCDCGGDKRAKSTVEAIIQLFNDEVIGKDQDEIYTSELRATWHDQEVESGKIAYRNQLRRELREKLGRKGGEDGK